MTDQPTLRIVLAKVGLDGHDRGVKVITRGLRDAGFHVIYPGLWQSPEAVVRTVADEDADWLGIKTQRLRDINGLAFRTPVVVGQRINIDLAKVNADTFEGLRAAYHKEQQDAFFRNNTITGVTEHVVRRGESVWILALRKYDVPVWLFRQYNPELDLHNVQRGTRLNFPVLVSNTPG